MGVIVTEIQLNEFLDEEWSWRWAELHAMKSLIQEIDSKQKSIFVLRAGVAFLYAHFEGFVKNSFSKYLEFVSNRKLKNNELARNFSVLQVEGLMSKFAMSSQRSKSEFLTKIFEIESSASRVPTENVINTKSNLNSDVLEVICAKVGLNSDKYMSKKPIIDEQLLKNRNHIAHGESTEITKSSFEELYGNIVDLMREIKTDISNAASLKSYKRVI